jgi:hypothetical protein
MKMNALIDNWCSHFRTWCIGNSNKLKPYALCMYMFSSLLFNSLVPKERRNTISHTQVAFLLKFTYHLFGNTFEMINDLTYLAMKLL